MSIQNERERALSVVCPYCFAAKGALCTTKIYSGAGTGTTFTNIFHAERIYKAQKSGERALDGAVQIQRLLDKYPMKYTK
jgi:hypothetical protein